MVFGALFCTTLVVSVASQQMSLCDYFEKLGIAKPECGHIIRKPTFNAFNTFNAYAPVGTFNNFNVPTFRPTFNSFAFNSLAGGSSSVASFGAALPLCRNYFHSCMSSSTCESGTVCTIGTGLGSCCTSPERASCPSATQLNINCRKLRSVNWCNSDADCRGSSTTPSMCCPTGCNYNMCVHVGLPVVHPRRSIAFSSMAHSASGDSCPDSYQLDIKCQSHRITSWCNSDSECRSGINTRKCCPTLCGYNACVMKFNNKWIVA
ncbi:unnamed protein product [Caenorhabditis auriculariae]|uniref:WAP domain-containing protein n=1 Tax=Caenorhabditis auriculariae TaxID=2777116 RepID=A0A8S1HK37_9PELO|nr:unnamed protein product [Caenorhabditis auriculariae]